MQANFVSPSYETDRDKHRKKVDLSAKNSEFIGLHKKSIASELKETKTLPDSNSPMSHFVDVLDWQPIV